MQRISLIILILFVFSPLFSQEQKLGLKTNSPVLNNTLPTAHKGPEKFGASSRSVDLSPLFPKPDNQGNLNSCVAWASAYALKSYLEHIERSNTVFDKDSLVFSPSFIYNQINGGKDQGSTLSDAGAIMKNLGAATLKIMPYTKDYNLKPNQDQLKFAANYKIESYQRVDPKNVDVIKSFLQKGSPVVIGMSVYDNFMTYRGGIYKSATGSEIGGHAMCILGFDDDKKAFKIINSWGPNWGEAGYCWIDYETFKSLNWDAMVFKDIQTQSPKTPTIPTKVSATEGSFDKKIQVNWEASSGVDFYEIHRGEQATGEFTKIAETKGTTFEDTKVENAKMYYYSVRSVIGDKKSEFSSVVQGFLQTQKGLGVVSGLSSKMSKTGVRLAWTGVSGAIGYNIYRYQGNDEAFALIGTSKDNAFEDPTIIDIPGVYYYMVIAFNERREGPNGDSLEVVVEKKETKVVKLISPKQITASQGSFKDKVEITWGLVEGIDQYIVLRYDEDKEVWKILNSAKGGKFVDPKPLPGEAYYSVVSRIDDTISSIEDFVKGFTSQVQAKKRSFDDDAYFGKVAKSDKALNNDSLFKGDKFFTNPSKFFTDTREKDFFFVNEAKFFSLDPDFFKLPDDFFVNVDKFFD